MSSSLSYRPDIDGLRAVAVLGVLFYHAGLGLPGGYIGVDVFFVISGFLITSLLLKELRIGTFSLWNFWERRARRILPALAVVVTAVVVAGWFFLLPADYKVLAKQIIALALFSSNIKFWRESGYFDTAAEGKPLLHTWSLSVEEQFYLLIPLLLALLFRYRKSGWCLPVLIVGALASFALSAYGSYRAPSATFYLLPTRAWELAVGAILAFTAAPVSARHRAYASWLGLAGIVLPCFLYVPGLRFPGLSALPPVAGAALLIWAGLPRDGTARLPLPSRLLASRLFVWIGLLSYSLYLWHWPIFAFQKYLGYGHDAWPVQLGLAALAFPLAWVSLRFVERPFRSRQTIRSRSLVFGLSAAAVASLVCVSLWLWKTGGAEQRLSDEARRVAAGATDFAFRHELDSRDVPERLAPFGAAQGAPSVFVWGDSHAMAALPAVDAACRELGLSGRAATHSSTAPVLGWFKETKYGLNERAPAFNEAVSAYLSQAVGAGGGGGEFLPCLSPGGRVTWRIRWSSRISLMRWKSRLNDCRIMESKWS